MMHILLVDDSVLMARAITRACSLSSMCMTVASDVEQALAILLREGVHAGRQPIDVVFTDLHLGARSGLDLVREIKGDSVLSCLPVVVLSVSRTQEQVREGYRLGVASWIAKEKIVDPVDLESIFAYWARCERIQI